jgi:hypothetical protein
VQWIVQEFEDTARLGQTLERLGLDVSFHKVVPFVGELQPEAVVKDRSDVVLFGSYSLRHYAKKHGLEPGVFVLRPFLYETAWHNHLLNGPDAFVCSVRSLSETFDALDHFEYFVRPVDDSKEIAGTVMTRAEIEDLMRSTAALRPEEYITGSINPDTMLLLSKPRRILREWRNWIIDDKVVTSSLYKLGSRVIYQEGIDPPAQAFLERMIALNPGYSPAYVLDVCETNDGYFIVETNCINAAGFYAADLGKLVVALEMAYSKV